MWIQNLGSEDHIILFPWVIRGHIGQEKNWSQSKCAYLKPWGCWLLKKGIRNELLLCSSPLSQTKPRLYQPFLRNLCHHPLLAQERWCLHTFVKNEITNRRNSLIIVFLNSSVSSLAQTFIEDNGFPSWWQHVGQSGEGLGCYHDGKVMISTRLELGCLVRY